MAAPLANKITLPSDTGNSGKNVRTQTRVVGSDTVHEHFFIPVSSFSVAGKYFFSSTQQSVSATVQDGIATGFFWLQLPSTATVTAAIRYISASSTMVATTAMPTAPVLSFSKFTFTGTASGTSVTPVKFQTAGAANQMIVRTAVTGMTNTIIGDVGNFQFPAVATGVGSIYSYEEVIPRNAQAYTRGTDLEIGSSEGLAIWQSVAGTAADARRFNLQLEWDEIDLT